MGFTNLINKGKGKGGKNSKSRKVKKKKTRLPGFKLALLPQLLASRAWNFTTQPRNKNARYVRSLNIMSRSITRPTVLKETLLAWFQMEIRVNKSDVNRANIFCRKNFKAEESVTFQNIFSSMADFRYVVSVLPAARLIKASRIFEALQKANSTVKNQGVVWLLS